MRKCRMLVGPPSRLIQGGMTGLLPVSDPMMIVAVFAIAMAAGIVKGVVGFGMPMILLSGLSGLISPEIALSALILPTLFTNGWQALRQGTAEALRSVRDYRRFLVTGGIVLVICAQAVPYVNKSILLTVLGIVIGGFAAMQLFGIQPKIKRPTPAGEVAVGVFAGFVGGISAVWGPPTVLYLTAMNTGKKDQIRIQGVIYGLGGLALTVAHIASGILNTKTAPFSALLLLPALAGMVIGFAIQDRIEQRVFKNLTLIVLIVAGLNLVRLGVLG